VQELIKVKNLGAELAGGLDPSVRDKYLELHQAVEKARSRQQGIGPE
jgi:hypothetical protein